ncbi:hypothetical protein D3C85_953210 [compost metagenome]
MRAGDELFRTERIIFKPIHKSFVNGDFDISDRSSRHASCIGKRKPRIHVSFCFVLKLQRFDEQRGRPQPICRLVRVDKRIGFGE